MGRLLNTNAYAVYVMHMAVLGVIALLMLGTEIPSLWKYLILTLSTWALSNAFAIGYREVIQPRALAWSKPEATQ